MKHKINVPIIIIGTLVVLIAVLLSATFGYANISFLQTFKILINQISPIFDTNEFPVNAEINIIYVRLPRILGAGLAGIGLTISGIIFQSILKNPLAEPYILGVSSGAALGAALSFLIPMELLFFSTSYITPLFALAGAIIASSTIIFISGSSFKTDKIILFGVSFNFLLSSVLTLIISMNHDKSSEILFWTMGSFTTMNYLKISIIFIVTVLGVIFSNYFSTELNLFSLGSTTAQTLGLNINKYRLILITTASLLTGVIVSFSGIIGFTGLIIPHLTRLFAGSDNRKVINYSIPIGAVFMIFSDTIARTLLINELPVGVVTSIIGAPLFIFLLKKRSKR